MKKFNYIFKNSLIPFLCGCFASLAVLSLYSGCSLDAERENPLDPNSPFYKSSSSLAGRITNVGDNPQGVADVQILLNPGNIAAVSNSDGSYSFSDLDPGEYTIHIQRQYLKSIDSTVNILVESSDTANFAMNFIPQLDSIWLYTLRTINVSSGLGEYEIFLNAVISDSDGTTNLNDTATVYWQGGSGKFVYYDDISIYSRLFIPIIDVEASALNDYLGINYSLQTYDLLGDSVKSGLIYVVRFIDEEMLTFSPNGIDTTGGKPFFTWHQPAVPYEFRYVLKLYNYPSPVQIYEEVLYDTSDMIVEVDTLLNTIGYIYKSYSPGESLDIGTYMWFMEIKDLIGNISRSREKIFEVQ